jgi:hypothetical protein
VALNYRYEPVTALGLIARLRDQYGAKNVEPLVPARVLAFLANRDLIQS